MSNRFDWKKLAEIADNLSKGYEVCTKCGTMWLGPEPAPCPRCSESSSKPLPALANAEEEGIVKHSWQHVAEIFEEGR